tara:strand:- start:52 stop:366 length:315 start_codon:yes stop_codon:yes gene_type:complete
MRNDDYKSEFYNFILGANEVRPMSFSGARQVVISVNDVTRSGEYVLLTNQPNVFKANGDIDTDQYMHLPDRNAGQDPLIVNSSDDMLYFGSTGANMLVQIWVIR